MNSLLKKMRKGHELEVRARLTGEQFKQAIIFMSTKPHTAVFENSISIAIDNERLVRMYYSNPTTKTIEYMAKERIDTTHTKHPNFGHIKVVVSNEKKIPKFNLSSYRNARIKPRASIVLDNNPDWRYDFTPSKEMKTFTKETLKAARDEMFVWKKTLEEYVADAPFDSATPPFELEIEYIGKDKPKKIDVNELLSIIMSPTMSDYNPEFHRVLSKIVKLVPRNRKQRSSTVKEVSNQVIALSKVIYQDEVQQIINSFDVLHKTDGTRCLVLMEDRKEYILTSGIKTGICSCDGPTIYDGELYENKVYVFDVMMYNGVNLTGKSFHIRKSYISKVIEDSDVAVAKDIAGLSVNSFRDEIKKFYEGKREFKTDGLILTPRDQPYYPMKVYKWKEPENITIDFLIKRCPHSLAGATPYLARPKQTMYLLFCGSRQDIRHKFMFPNIRDYHQIFPNVQQNFYRPALFRHPQNMYDHIYYNKKETLDGKVGEFIRKRGGGWTLVRIREDRQIDISSGKYFGNDYKTASNNYDNYYNPLLLADIYKAPNYGYFNSDNRAYAKVRKFNSFVKQHLIHRFKGAKAIIDLAAGQGQDLMRYSKMNVEKALMIDIDAHAIAKLNSRRFNIPNPMGIWTMITDLTQPKDTTIGQIARHFEIPQTGADLIICNFALHYLTQTKNMMTNSLGLVKTLLGTKKHFIATFFDGDEILKIVQENNDHPGEWRVETDGLIRYSIKVKNTKKLAKYGHRVDLILPFSGGEYYTETLINFRELVLVAKKLKMEVETGLFSDFFDKPGMPELDKDDRKFAGLYRWVVLKNTKQTQYLPELLRTLV
jgi:hypothetical protein